MRSLLLLAAMASDVSADERVMRRVLAELPSQVGGVPNVVIEAAHRYATAVVSPELIVALSWAESKFSPRLRTGRVCGVMQVNPSDLSLPRSLCDVWDRDPAAAVAAGIYEIELMLADRRVRGDIRRALMYRACGNAAFSGRCRKGPWVDLVLHIARRMGDR